MLIPPFSLKTSNFFSPQNWEKWEGMDLGLMKFLLKSLKYPFNISPFFSFSRKKNIAIILADIARPLQSEAAATCLSFSFVCCNFRLLLKPSMSIFFFFLFGCFLVYFIYLFFFMNYLLVIHESDI